MFSQSWVDRCILAIPCLELNLQFGLGPWCMGIKPLPLRWPCRTLRKPPAPEYLESLTHSCLGFQWAPFQVARLVPPITMCQLQLDCNLHITNSPGHFLYYSTVMEGQCVSWMHCSRVAWNALFYMGRTHAETPLTVWPKFQRSQCQVLSMWFCNLKQWPTPVNEMWNPGLIYIRHWRGRRTCLSSFVWQLVGTGWLPRQSTYACFESMPLQHLCMLWISGVLRMYCCFELG